MSNRINHIVIAGGLLALASPEASATLMFTANVGGVLALQCSDNQGSTALCPGGDTNLAIGTLALADNTYNGLVRLQGSVQTSTAGLLNILNSSSLQITALDEVGIRAAVSDTDYVGPVDTAFASLSGTSQLGVGSFVAYSFYNDPNNQQGAEDPFDTPGDLIDGFSFGITKVADSYSHASGPISVNDPGSFSMTQVFEADLRAGTVLVNNGLTEIKPLTTSVPEPASTLGMLGIGLIGLWFGNTVYRRKNETLRLSA